MIYLKNNTETQAIYIPRQTVLGGGYIPSTKAYEKGYNDGLEDGKEQQKEKLSSLHVAENGQYEREDGWNVVNVDVPDLNGSYNEGYEQGKTEGINEQKGKLESISITENGVYSKEDGYNHIEVNVPDLNGSYEQGQADMAAKARVLNVTENGTYLSKFSDTIKPTITGVYADGTEFHNYAYLEGISYDSGFIVSEDMKVEIWWKGDVSKTDKNLFGSQVNNNYAIFKIRIPDTAYRFDGEIAMKQVTYLNAESNRWYHFKMSYADGFWVDDVKIGDFSSNISGTPYKLYINSNTPHSFNGVNGYFGMIKITTNGVENIIIPTAEGLKNITTNEMLQVELNGTYTFTENLPIYGEGELYKTINVNVSDLNGSYDEGKIDGINEQKSKLETIEITVNGTYNRGDGYNKIIVKVPDLNGSYDEGYEQGHSDGYNEGYSEGEGIGYEQGQVDIAANAKVLNVTENGVYKTKFSDPIMPTLVTGVYADGTEFYDYAKLKGKVFNTNILATMNSRIEFWYKGDNTLSGDAYNVIMGAHYMGDSIVFEVIYDLFSNSEVRGRIGSTYLNTNWDESIWHHIILSKNDGFIVDGVKIGDMQNASYTSNGNFLINANSYNNQRNANGYFGMIKIDDTIIIPTADGFKNVNTGELLEVVKNGTYTFTKNLPTYGEGEIYKTINVNVPDLNGSYDEGKTDGINEQKSKLETINITENGTYRKEDGYNEVVVNVADLNGSYDEGYAQGQADIAAKARVLDVTENGVYKTKFSDPIMPTLVTGVYADGTEFYNYAELNGKIFNTKIAATVDSRLEFWYKGDNTSVSGGWNAIIGAGNTDNRDCFQVRYWDNNNGRLLIEIGNSGVNYYNWDDTVWHHLIISKAEGLWIDGKKEWNFKQPTNTVNGEFLINGVGYNVNSNANGYFGMIKIDNVVIIPTADGFLNTNTGELLEVVKDGTYTYTENLPIYGEGELYKTINVNVPSVQDEALQYDTIAFSYTVYNWSNHNINRDNMTTNCGDRPLDCLLFRNRLGECTVMTKLDNCSGTAQLENGWTEDNIIRTLKSKTITKFLSNSINSNQLTSIDTGLAQLKENAIINCNALTDIKLAILNNNLSVQFASNCFNGLPAEGTITIGKTADVTLTDDEITSFFRTIVGEGWTITIK